ncbi:PLP-dependent aminotransferase family protein [Rhodococcus sp. MS13]|uniref:MocR-like pyridoxine biosynthesis transcription factor PdxR n=1 Tax=Rhodococcus sp. MS13 TaxID=2579940 RepID=UPI0015627EA2|nr:PLP-dependent aminotransferase family protein [Rhodococcus sp. MS13]NRH33249.1 PLP-dependent aminotransferase family protein [Rhodococcus sp. MS13]
METLRGGDKVARSMRPNLLQLYIAPGDGSMSSRLSAALVGALVDGQLDDGDDLPSSRVFAHDLGISRSVVVAAYQELIASGFFVSKSGGSTRVELGARNAALAGALSSSLHPTDQRTSLPDEPSGPVLRFDLLPGYPDTSLINRTDWSRAIRTSAGGIEDFRPYFGTSDPELGSRHNCFPELQSILADHIRRRRGFLADPEDIYIFTSVNASLKVLLPVLVESNNSIAIEDPGYVTARNAITGAGFNVRSIGVDEGGMMVSHLRGSDAAVYVTPAHQFPMGSRMSVDRRAQLLEWAEREGSLVFEDDYDGEFRYGVPPMPALRGMGSGSQSVVYLGTASKVLARDLRIAWAVVPKKYRSKVRQRVAEEGDSVSPIAAKVLSSFIRSEALTRHIVSAHHTYAARRQRFAEACRELLPEMKLEGIDAGLHVVLSSEKLFDDVTVVKQLQQRGLACMPLSGYYLDKSVRIRNGLVCGYSRLPETQALHAVKTLRDVLDRNGV